MHLSGRFGLVNRWMRDDAAIVLFIIDQLRPTTINRRPVRSSLTSGYLVNNI